jgi:uncharacterized membrane protein
MTDGTIERQFRPWPAPPPSRQTIGLVVLAALGLGAGSVLSQPSASAALVAIAGVLLAFGVPGIAMTRALFPGPGLGRAERITLVVGIQLSLTVMCGFLLHLLRPGLSSASWGSILADITLLACAVAWVRGRHIDASATAATPRRTRMPGWGVAVSSATTRQLALLVGAVVLAGLSLVIARAGVELEPRPAWTALGITAADAGRAVDIQVTDAEGHPQTYRLVATIDGEPLTTVDDLKLADGAASIARVALPPAGAFLRQVVVSLWRADDDPAGEPYRQVQLSLRGVPGP